VGARRLGQDEQYLTVREILSEASTLVPPRAGLPRERSDFYRFGSATLGLSYCADDKTRYTSLVAVQWAVEKWEASD
jgi:hypothetical protein